MYLCPGDPPAGQGRATQDGAEFPGWQHFARMVTHRPWGMKHLGDTWRLAPSFLILLCILSL